MCPSRWTTTLTGDCRLDDEHWSNNKSGYLVLLRCRAHILAVLDHGGNVIHCLKIFIIDGPKLAYDVILVQPLSGLSNTGGLKGKRVLPYQLEMG